MEFDIIEVSDDYYDSLTMAQRRVLREAQIKKNGLVRKAEKEIAKFRRKLYTNGVQTSSLLAQKTAEIYSELEYETEVLKSRLLFDIERLTPDKEEELDYSSAPYLVDFKLNYTDRYVIVRDYYLSLPDPRERVQLYLQDEIAKIYLGIYYTSLYNVLMTYV